MNRIDRSNAISTFPATASGETARKPLLLGGEGFGAEEDRVVEEREKERGERKRERKRGREKEHRIGAKKSSISLISGGVCECGCFFLFHFKKK